MMLLVSGSTRTVCGLADCCRGNLGHLLTPSNRNGMAAILATGLPWAADNGAFSGFDPNRFRRLLRKIRGQPRCLFVVCPDVVANARATLAQFPWWRLELAAAGVPVALVGQNGAEDLPIPWDDFDCWFIGGDTRWKLSQASADLAAEAKARGKWVHMGRVNSLRRLEAAYLMGCDSVGGSSMSMFGDKYIHQFVRWVRGLQTQPLLFGGPSRSTTECGTSGCGGETSMLS